MRDVTAIILGGGQGTRLYPLTKYRAKPAVPLAGKYRLIDIPLSNCINSAINRIFVLTQFNSASLNRHISRTYRFSIFTGAFVEVLAAQQTLDNPNWFQGTADAVRQYLSLFESTHAREFLVLSGDHLYRMDYQGFIRHHRKSNADVTVAVHPVSEKAAPGFGILKTDDSGQVIDYQEKPQPDALKKMRVDTQKLGLDAEEAAKKPYIASMGIYVFNREVLPKLLRRAPHHSDFGREVMPGAMADHKMQSYLFNGYWEDIGTISSFYEANIGLLRQPAPNFSFFEIGAPIYARPRFLPCTEITDSHIETSMIADGCVIRNARIQNAIIGIRSRIESKVRIENSIISGADYFEAQGESAGNGDSVRLGIGQNTIIKNAIVDKNARIGRNVRITNKDRVSETTQEEHGYCISNGIVIVIKDSVIPDGTVI